MESIPVTGNDRSMAALAARTSTATATASPVTASILLGSIDKGSRPVRLELSHLPPKPWKLTIERIPATHLTTPIAADQIEHFTDFAFAEANDGATITLKNVAENEVYSLKFSR